MKLVLVNDCEDHKIVDAENGNTWVYEPEGENENSPVSRLIFNGPRWHDNPRYLHGLVMIDNEANTMWAWLKSHLAA